MIDRAKLNAAFPNGFTGDGIFTALQTLDVPWKNENISATLDVEYFGNVSGDKYVSPLINKLLLDDNTISEFVIEQVAQTIYNLFNRNWLKLWDTFSLEYDPIQNYSMVENLIDDERVTAYGKSRTRTVNLQHSKTGTESDDRERTDNTANDLYGFNSSTPVHADETDLTIADDNTHTYNITDSDTGTQIEADSGRDSETRNYELTRRGNIGVTTSQQMIQSERDLWMWDFFHSVVFPDVDRILTIQIY